MTEVDQDNLYPNINGNQISKKDVIPEEISHKIKGKTLEVYYFLIHNHGASGVREIQRALEYSSSSVAAYHLDRLYNFDLVNKTDDGKYYVEGDPVQLGELKNHIIIAGKKIPKVLSYGYQAISAIIIAIILMVLDISDPIIWGLYVIISNTIFLSFIIKDAINAANKIRPSSASEE